MSNKKVIFGLALVAIGVILLGNSLDIFYFDFEDFFRIAIPLGLIFLGAWLIIRRRQRELGEGDQGYAQSNQGYHSSSGQSASGHFAGAGTPPPPPPPPHSESGAESGQYNGTGRVRYNRSFGDMFIDLNGVTLQNVEVSSMFGDVEIKLHGGILQPGLNRLVISGFLGDIRVLAPTDMPIMTHISSFGGDIHAMGRTSSGFGNRIESQSPNYQSAERRLFIAINTFLGDTRLIQI
jgi:lia operon protein LiaF